MSGRGHSPGCLCAECNPGFADLVGQAQQGSQLAALQGKRLEPTPDFTVVTPAGRREQRIAFLERKRKVTIEDARLKLEGEDWHGVADAAMDLRDINNELDGLRFE